MVKLKCLIILEMYSTIGIIQRHQISTSGDMWTQQTRQQSPTIVLIIIGYSDKPDIW